MVGLEYASHDPHIHYYRNEANVRSVENFARMFRLSKGNEYFMWAIVPELLHFST